MQSDRVRKELFDSGTSGKALSKPFLQGCTGQRFLLQGEAGHSEIFFGMGRGGAGAKSSGHGTAGQS